MIPRKAAAEVLTLFVRLRAIRMRHLSTRARMSSYNWLLETSDEPRKFTTSSIFSSSNTSTAKHEGLTFSRAVPFAGSFLVIV